MENWLHEDKNQQVRFFLAESFPKYGARPQMFKNKQ